MSSDGQRLQQSVARELSILIDEPGRRSEVSAVELATAFLERIDALQPHLHALITVTEGLALSQAFEADAARARGRPLPLDGMPVVVKDIVDVAGVRSTRGSRVYADRVARSDAPVVGRLREAGAVILGTANLHEFAFGGTSRNEAFGHVVNPWDPGVIAGGSSGGSGAAVAADLCVVAVGSDTGGSIRIPASCCGVSGIRPTVGAVPTDGVFPVSETLDTVGPLARAVDDLRSALVAMAQVELGERPVSDLRLGRLRGYFAEGVDPEVGAAVDDAAAVLTDLGAGIVDIELAGAADASAACGALIRAEALIVHREHLEGVPELMEAGTRRRLDLARSLTEADLAAAREVMQAWRETLRQAFEDVDLLLAPTLPVAPPAAGDAETVATTELVTPFTFAVSLGRVPALSLPCGFTAGGHPIGLQLVAPWERDDLLLAAGAGYQSATDWHRRRPAYAGSILTTS